MPETPPPRSVKATTKAALQRLEPLIRRLKKIFQLRRLYLVRADLKFAPSEAQRLFALTVAIGALCGLAAVAFHLTISTLEHHLIDRAMHSGGRAWMAWTVVTPLLGGLVCGILLHYVVPNARGSGIPQVKVAFASESGRASFTDAVGKFFVGALQIGSGSSLGREGPTVQICAGIASPLGRLIGASPRTQRRLLPVGVAAGIAAAFNAPIAAVTFTIEEVVGKLDQAVLSGVIVAAALAAVIEHSILGSDAVFDVPETYAMPHASSLLVYALLGVAAALVSFVFTESLLWLRARFQRSRLPPWARPAVGGGVTGALAVVALVTLGAEGVTGGGYETLGQALTGRLTTQVMLALCGLKLVATVFSYASGGAGGIFAPVLFLGGTLGGAFGTLDQVLLGHADAEVGAYALVGMGATFAGVIRAPITSVLIIAELTHAYSLILPLMIANMTAYVLARRFRSQSIYEALLEQDGIELPQAAPAGTLEGRLIDPVIDTDPVPSFAPASGAREVSQVVREHGSQHVYPVLEGSRLVGMITPDELGILATEPELLSVANAADLMREPVSVRRGDDLRAALEAMLQNGIREVPVIDDDGRFVGLIDESAIARAYLERRGNGRSGQRA